MIPKRLMQLMYRIPKSFKIFIQNESVSSNLVSETNNNLYKAASLNFHYTKQRLIFKLE